MKKLWQDPHPLVEDHYHIQELLEKQEIRSEERSRLRSQKEAYDQLVKDIQSYPEIATLDFWCSHCQVDFIGRAHKQVDSWAPIAYYKIKHRCGTWSIRHITERLNDSYFFRSKKVAYDRFSNYNEMIQPFQTGYNALYGKTHRNHR